MQLEFTIYRNEYRDIMYEIHHTRNYWTYYLFINLRQMPKYLYSSLWLKSKNVRPISKHSRTVFYDYSSVPLLRNLDWHGGITWYSKESGLDGADKVVKIGCDYQHLSDHGNVYNRDMIERDVINCIDSLHEAVPNIKRRCEYCGAYFKPKENEIKCRGGCNV